MDDSVVRFYTGIPSLALLMVIFSILKPSAEKMKYWVKGESTQAGEYMARFFPLLHFNVFFLRDNKLLIRNEAFKTGWILDFSNLSFL